MNPTVQDREFGLAARPPSRPDSAVALVDLDNWHEIEHDRPIESTLTEVVFETTRRLLEVEPEIGFISIRLYGGWTESGAMSQAASRVATHLGGADPFPIPTEDRLVHGELHLATGISMVPSADLGDLCRVRQGPPRLRLASTPRPIDCADHAACAAKALQKFTSGGQRVCPTDGCAVVAAKAFSTRQQKMVDTMMTCDLLDFVHDPDVLAVTVVTADTDLMPPLVHALALGRVSILLQTNLPYWPPTQLETLRRCGIIYFGPEGDQ